MLRGLPRWDYLTTNDWQSNFLYTTRSTHT